MTRPAVIVTRPAREAQLWVNALQEAGWNALALPLIDIAPPTDIRALERCRQHWQTYDAVMFVSAQAVTGFMGAAASACSSTGVRCWAPGPGTARALHNAGVPVDRIDAPSADAEQFDSEALWAVVAHQLKPGFRLLIVRGESQGQHPGQRGNGRDWLAKQCESAGARVDWCVAYQRRAPEWTFTELQAAQQHAQDGSLWLFSSSEALAHLAKLAPKVSWAGARAVVTHPRIAQAAQGLGFGTIITTRPALPDVLRSLSLTH